MFFHYIKIRFDPPFFLLKRAGRGRKGIKNDFVSAARPTKSYYL